ncbi:probable aldo-keto reductase [Cephalotrichum gorgonifer]|uniref:Probable aldo-keto reductase n=1 Tax=Cephalotrichum gorgonifer TaxID=2041049 RepID=A0AAE8MPU5_9PEZI|nr:probable aldo-keto reductase [Cephalotrichum gorgonifer]
MAGAPLPPGLQESLAGTHVDYRRVGASGLRVSTPIVGCMSIGNKEWADWVIEADQALPMLKAAYDRGLNTWDTANIYSNGDSERIIAQAIKTYNIPRHKLVIMSKAYSCVGEQQFHAYHILKDLVRSKDYVNQFGLSRQALFKTVNDILERLETDYLDVFWIHRFDPETPIEETMCALHDLVKAGKIRYLGASSMWTYQFVMMQNVAEKNGWTKFVAMQGVYSLLYREEEREMNKYCNTTGVGLLPWGPLSEGQLVRPLSVTGTTTRSSGGEELRAESKEIINRVEELAKKKGWTMAQVTLAWTNKRVTSPIIGFSSVERIDQALAARGLELTAEEEAYLEEPYTPREIMGHF